MKIIGIINVKKLATFKKRERAKIINNKEETILLKMFKTKKQNGYHRSICAIGESPLIKNNEINMLNTIR